MSRIIEEQLKQVKVANLNNHIDNTYIIPKYIQFKYEIDKCYLVKLDESLLDYEQSRILACNWNNNRLPSNLVYKFEVDKIMGKMIYVNGIAYDLESNSDLSNIWSGWLPIEKIKLIEVL